MTAVELPANLHGVPLWVRLFHCVAVEPDTGCWLKPANTRQGYAQIMVAGKRIPAHRITYTWLNGPPPTDLEIDHLCKVRNCINPSHLEAVTHAENMRRTRLTHCRKGHELTPDNVYPKSGARGQRRTCIANRHKKVPQ